MELGKIVIKEKVYFEYYELEKPNEDHYIEGRNWAEKTDITLNEAMQAYEASKKTVEVSNEIQSLKTKKIRWNENKHLWTRYKNNQKCKAEVNGTAEIIELIK